MLTKFKSKLLSARVPRDGEGGEGGEDETEKQEDSEKSSVTWYGVQSPVVFNHDKYLYFARLYQRELGSNTLHCVVLFLCARPTHTKYSNTKH